MIILILDHTREIKTLHKICLLTSWTALQAVRTLYVSNLSQPWHHVPFTAVMLASRGISTVWTTSTCSYGILMISCRRKMPHFPQEKTLFGNIKVWQAYHNFVHLVLSQRSAAWTQNSLYNCLLSWPYIRICTWRILQLNRLVGLVVKASASRAEDPGFDSACARIFSGSSHTSDSKIGAPVATLPGAWRCRVSTGTGQPGVSILWLGEMESLVCSFSLSVTAPKIVWADLSLRYTCMLLGR